jgi:thiamine-phosphate pyrophosphorylase
MMPARWPRVYLITDRSVGGDLLARVAAAVAGLPPGTAAVQLREKDLGGRELLALARALRAPVEAAGQALLVNDRADVALAAGARGVHLPSEGIPPAEARRLLGPAAWIGVSCHTAEEVRWAREGGADFATFGPLFDTPSKRAHGAPVGLARLTEAAALGLPLVGLGGIDEARVPEVLAAGASGVAAIRAWLAAADPGAVARALLRVSG